MNNWIFTLIGLLIVSSMTYTSIDVVETPELKEPDFVDVIIVESETEKLEVTNKVTGTNFTDKLYSVMPKDKNYMYSPLSVKLALAMAANGAKGITKQEILDTLDITNLDAFNQDTIAIINKYSDNNVIRLDIANSIWLNTDTSPYDFSEGYKKTILDFYNGEAREVTLKTAVPKVNGWVNEKTNGKIPTIINESFDAALVNAIYFKGNWENDFNENSTKKDIFTDRNGKETEIDFMCQTNRFLYGESDGIRVLELPYKTVIKNMDEKTGKITNERLEDADVSMFILLSDNEITEPEKIVSELYYNDRLESKKTNLSLPKFEIEYDRELTEILQTLGIKTAFSGNADFDSMFETENSKMAFSQVIHKTFISVDEKGTEAAAVTAILMKATSARPQPEEIIEFKADKPFTFLIRDNVSGETLFIGEYAFVQ